jgi:hypothetical protein
MAKLNLDQGSAPIPLSPFLCLFCPKDLPHRDAHSPHPIRIIPSIHGSLSISNSLSDVPGGPRNSDRNDDVKREFSWHPHRNRSPRPSHAPLILSRPLHPRGKTGIATNFPPLVAHHLPSSQPLRSPALHPQLHCPDKKESPRRRKCFPVVVTNLTHPSAPPPPAIGDSRLRRSICQHHRSRRRCAAVGFGKERDSPRAAFGCY